MRIGLMEYPTNPQVPVTFNQSVPVTSDEVLAGVLQEERARNIIEQLSPDKQLQEAQWRLRGYVRDPVTKDWVKINPNAPEPNAIMIQRFTLFLSAFLQQGAVLSTFSVPQINSLMKYYINRIKQDLLANARDIYGLGDDYTEWSRVGDVLLFFIFVTLNRAVNGMEAKRIFNSFNLSENISQQPQQKKKWTDALKIWK